MRNLAVLVSGGGSNLQAVIDATESGAINARVSIVVSSNAEAYALERAKRHGIDTLVAALKDYGSAEQRDEAIIKALSNRSIDYIVLCGYLGILTSQFFTDYRGKIINIHPSLLPKHGGKGMHGIRVHREVLRCGDAITGATVHFVDEGVDTGEIIRQKTVAVDPQDNEQILQQKVLQKCEHLLLPEVLAELCRE